MNLRQALVALGPVDARSVGRDPLLGWIIVYPLLAALLVRLVTAPFAAWLMARFGFDLTPYYPLIMSFVLLTPPMLVGMVIGFLLLDQHDDHSLAALRVTPLPLPAYLAYRIAVPLALSVAMTLVALPLAGLIRLPLAANLAAAIAAAPMAPLYALALAAFAENKVQGFALMKAMGVLTIPVCLAWFVAPPLQWLLGIDPLFWPARLYWELAAGGGAVGVTGATGATGVTGVNGAAAVYLLIGLAYQALIVALLIRRFNRRVLD